ncbi:MAG: basic amino acid/polyamine antiporter [Anaerovoracaceae bacterium]
MTKLDDGSQKLSYFKLTGVAIGSTVASGAFSLSGDMAANGAGTAAVLVGWALCGIGMLALVLCFFQLNKVRPELTGGIYSYAREGYGDYVGFNSAWGYWVSTFLANVSFATLLFSAMGHFFPIFEAGNNLLSIICASAVTWLAVLLVCRGVKEAAAVNLVVTFAKLVPIFLFIMIIVFLKAFDLNIFMNNFMGEDTGLTFLQQIKATTYTTAWTFIGIEGAVVISGRAKRSKDVGRATITSYLAVLFIYVMISILSMGIMSRAELADLGNPPLAAILTQVMGPLGGVIINIGVIISLLGATLGHVIISAECAYEAAAKGSFCLAFGRVNKRHSPVFTLVVTNALVQIFLIVVYFNASTYQVFYTISTTMMIIPYLLSSMYYWKLVSTEKHYLEKKNINPLGAYIVAIMATIYGIWLIYSGGMVGLMISALLYAPGTIIYIWGKREKNQPAFAKAGDKAILGIILILFVLSLVLIARGVIKPF